MSQTNLKGQLVRFWYLTLLGSYISTGVVVDYTEEENCLTVKDNVDSMEYYISTDQIKPI
jgi:Tfp pilus assembly protein PilZ